MVWLIAAALSALGVAALVVGLRGRRVNDHPVCRGCGFDLAGVYPAREGCPECGRSLRGARAVRMGTRLRRVRTAWLGAAMLAAALGVAGAAGWSSATGFNWNTVKPVWMLRMESRSALAGRAHAAVTELARRAEKLGDETLLEFAEEGVAIQHDRPRDWLPAWGDLVEEAWLRGLLSEEQRVSYASRVVAFTVRTRPRIVQGDPLPIEVVDSTGLASNDWKPGLRAWFTVTLPEGYEGVRFKQPPARSMTPMGLRIGGGSATMGGAYECALAPGEHVVPFRLRVRMYEPRSGENGLDEPPDGAVVVEWEEERPCRVVVAPRGESAAVAVGGEEGREATLRTLSVDRVELPETGHEGTMIYFECGGLPVAVAGRMTLRQGGREWALGRVRLRAGSSGLCGFGAWDTPGLEEGGAELVITPAPEAAGTDIDTVEYFGEELTLPAHVVRSDPEQ